MKKKTSIAMLLAATLLMSGCSEGGTQLPSMIQEDVQSIAQAMEASAEEAVKKEDVWEKADFVDLLHTLKDVSDIKSYDFSSEAEIKIKDSGSIALGMNGKCTEAGAIMLNLTLSADGETNPLKDMLKKPLEFEIIMKDKTVYVNAKELLAISSLGGADVSYLDGLSKDYIKIDLDELNKVAPGYSTSEMSDVDEETLNEVKEVVSEFLSKFGEKLEDAAKGVELADIQKRGNSYKFEIGKENIGNILGIFKNIATNDLGKLITSSTKSITAKDIRTQIEDFVKSYNENGSEQIAELFDEITKGIEKFDTFTLTGSSELDGEKGSRKWDVSIEAKIEYDSKSLSDIGNVYTVDFDDTDIKAPEAEETKHIELAIGYSFTAKEISPYTEINVPAALTMDEFQLEVQELTDEYYRSMYPEYYEDIDGASSGDTEDNTGE